MSQSRTSKAFALSLGRGLQTTVTFGIGIAAARLLTKTELATYRQTILAYMVAMPVLGLGMNQAIYYFLPVAKQRLRGILVDATVILAGLGCLYGVFIACGGNHLLAKRFSNPAIVNTLLFIIPLPIIALPATLIPPVLVVRERVNTLAIFDLLSKSCVGIGVLVACLIWRQPESMVLARVILASAGGLIGLGLAFRSLPIDSWEPRLSSMTEMAKFGVPLGLASMMGTIALQLDKVVVSAMQSPELFAIYSVGAIEIPLIGIVTQSISSVIFPDIRKAVARGDTIDALRLFRRAAEKSAWVLLPTMLFFLASADSFMIVLFSNRYAASAIPFRIYLLLLPVRIALYGPLLMSMGKSKLILFRSVVGLLMNACLTVFLVWLYGYIGAAIATVATIYLWNVTFNLVTITRHFQVGLGDVIPLSTLAQIICQFAAPLVLVLILQHIVTVETAAIRLMVNAAVFLPFAVYYLHGNVYDFSSLSAKAKRLLGRD